MPHLFISFFFFFNDTATTEIYTLSLHDALPISLKQSVIGGKAYYQFVVDINEPNGGTKSLISLDMLKIYTSSTLQDRKSTRLNSSHGYISYAVFCLKKKKNQAQPFRPEYK